MEWRRAFHSTTFCGMSGRNRVCWEGVSTSTILHSFINTQTFDLDKTVCVKSEDYCCYRIPFHRVEHRPSILIILYPSEGE